MKTNKPYRSRTDYVIAGVAGGLAKFLSIDPTVTRLIFIALTLGGGSGVLVYIILALVIPREPGEEVAIDRGKKVRELASEVGGKTHELVEELKENHTRQRPQRRTGSALGIGLVALGIVLIINKLVPIHLESDWFWPVVLVGLGAYLLIK